MRQTTGVDIFPVFPDWVFTGKVILDQKMLGEVLHEINSLNKNKKYYGFETQEIGPKIQAMRKLVGNAFYNSAMPHFRLDQKEKTLEACDASLMSIKPGHAGPVDTSWRKWYRCIVYLQAPQQGSGLKLQVLDGKHHTNIPGVTELTKVIPPAPLKFICWPGHIPASLSENTSDSDTLVFCQNFVVKNLKS